MELTIDIGIIRPTKGEKSFRKVSEVQRENALKCVFSLNIGFYEMYSFCPAI